MALNPPEFYELLQQADLKFFTGVPDSLLKDFLAYVTDQSSLQNNIIAANEGNALALAAGYYLATGKIGVVYMQNSGLGNTINPLTSLTDSLIYSIPVLLLIGWRAEPGKKDEPQHSKMGKITLGLLELLGIKYSLLPDSITEAEIIIKQAKEHLTRAKAPYALVVKEGRFDSYQLLQDSSPTHTLVREQALKLIIPLVEEQAAIICTTGKTSRELFELRSIQKAGHQHDFLTVGSMGHSSSIALGIALQQTQRPVYCLDGDGALLMHLGAISTIGKLRPRNFRHILFNNYAHDSVGGQPTASDTVDFIKIVLASGYTRALSAETIEEIKEKFVQLKQSDGPAFLEIKCNKGARKDLGRPTRTPMENKLDFMSFLKDGPCGEK